MLQVGKYCGLTVDLVDLWRSFPETHGEALDMLGPIKLGRGFRFSFSCSVADSEMLADVTARGPYQ